MNRLLFASLITAGLLCSATALYALAPGQLFKIPSSNIGDKIKTVAGSSAVPTVTAFKSDSTYQLVANLLTIPLYAYNPMLGAAASFAVGYAFDSQYDLQKAYNNNWLQQSPALNAVINQAFPTSTQPPVVNDIVNQSCFGSVPPSCTKTIQIQNIDLGVPSYRLPPSNPSCIAQGFVYWHKISCCDALGRELGRWVTLYGTPVTDQPTWPLTGPPQTLNDQQAQTLAQRIVEALTSNPAIKEALNEIAKQHPDVVQSPEPITQQDITNWANTNNYNLNQQYIDYLTTIYNSTTGDFHTQVGIELEKAKAEAEKEEAEKLKEETFSPISDNPFTAPYNPGEYDIPARFTTFLNRVKSTGLFSFSADFFNSLPGGGVTDRPKGARDDRANGATKSGSFSLLDGVN